jgi:hypothetical protein
VKMLKVERRGREIVSALVVVPFDSGETRRYRWHLNGYECIAQPVMIREAIAYMHSLMGD